MASNNDNKYGGNSRGLWRKVYGYQNSKPQVVTVIDPLSNVTRSLDLSKTLRHRDFFIINAIASASVSGITSGSAYAIAQYDEGLINFSSIRDTGTGSFAFTFSSVPIVVLSVESASLYGGNLNVFGFNITTTQFTFGLSAPFTGSIRYRAIYSPTYPALASSSYTASITASANISNPLGNYAFTASFADLPGTPTSFRQTAWDTVNNGNANAFLSSSNVGVNFANVEITTGVSTSIDYIAFY